MKRSVMIVEKIKINIGKIWILILFMIVLMVPSMLIKAEDNKQVPAIIESFKINNTKEECNFTYNLEEATEWMSNITGIKKNGQIIPMSKCTINTEGGTIIIKTALSENDKISISAEGYQDVTFVIQGEHLFNTVWKHDENTHWKECMVKGCGLKTDVTDHSGGQASCQKKAECEVCGQEYGELEAHNYGSEWKHDETSHWRECQTEGCTAKTDVTKHSGGQATCQQKAECEVCSQEYGEFGVHNYGKEWKHDETSHWRECQTEGCTAKTDVAKHSGGQATCQQKAECEVCNQEYGEFGAHNYGSEWKHDGTSHWRECQTEGCTEKTDVAVHSGGQATCQKKAECDICNQEYGELGAHNYGSEWKHDETSHWRECQTEGCTDKTDAAVHSGGQATCQKKAECDVCNQEYGEFGAHNYGSEWKHDGTSHWRECQTEGCTAKTDVAKHSGGQATYQKKAICSVCKVSYGEVKKEDKATKVATQIKKLDVKVSNLTMKKISEVQAVRKAYNVLSKKEKDTIKKEVSTLTKAETLIKQNNCGTNVYYRFSNNTLTIFGKGAMKNCFTGSFTSKNIKSKIKNRIYQKYASKVVNVVVEQGVTKIGNGAFACMPKLKTARIQGSIGTAAFWGCTNLEKVTYVNGKGTMEFACFAECKKLKNIVIAEGVSAMDKSCFANCKKLKKVELPTTLKSIGEICFFGCSNVTVTIKGKITKCDVYAFYKVRNCKIVLKTAAAKKGKKVLAKALKKGKNKTVKIK